MLACLVGLQGILSLGEGRDGSGQLQCLRLSGPFFFLTGAARILPSEKSSSAEDDSGSKLSERQNSKSFLESNAGRQVVVGFDGEECIAFCAASKSHRLKENEILGLKAEKFSGFS